MRSISISAQIIGESSPDLISHRIKLYVINTLSNSNGFMNNYIGIHFVRKFGIGYARVMIIPMQELLTFIITVANITSFNFLESVN